MTDNRYVGLRCPLCGAQSPTVDQVEDIRREGMSEWWHRHKIDHLPLPIIERRTP